MKLFSDFILPATVEEATAELKRLGSEGMPVAGATSLVMASHNQPKVAVDLLRILPKGIEASGDDFLIGAGARIADLSASAGEGWVLDRVATHFVTQQIRNMATVGGSIARVYSWSDLPAPLMALAATITLQGDEDRQFTADEYFDHQPARLFEPGDLLTQVRVPRLQAGQGFGYRKERRTAADFSYATAAAWIEVEGKKIRAARVALSACVGSSCRLSGVETAVLGGAGSRKRIEAAVTKMGDCSWRRVEGYSEDYIRHAASVAVCDALEQAWAEATGDAS